MKSSFNIIKRSFGNWKPEAPLHKMVIDPTHYRMPHPIWNIKEAETVNVNHLKPQKFRDYVAYYAVKTVRASFDFVSGYKPGSMTENAYIRRVLFLETVAAIPGMMAAMIRHMRSLRTMNSDGGWIHHLLEEAENERMHLFMFIKLRNPGILLRLAVLGAQGIFITGYSTLYLLSPSTAHRFVGYLEEEAVKTYTNILKELDEGKLPLWLNLRAPEDAIKYWGLEENAKFRDVIIAVRADEVMHREVNHYLAGVGKDSPIVQHKLNFVENMIGENVRVSHNAKDDSYLPPQ